MAPGAVQAVVRELRRRAPLRAQGAAQHGGAVGAHGLEDGAEGQGGFVHGGEDLSSLVHSLHFLAREDSNQARRFEDSSSFGSSSFGSSSFGFSSL